LFCGAGGAAKGLQQAGFHVTGVDIKPQPRYCGDAFVQADAMTFPLDGYDLIWASPPCQAYVQRNKNLDTRHPRLIEPIRERLAATGTPYIIENVEGAPLIAPTLLCGTMFGLRVRRHRLFETPFMTILTSPCHHWGTVAAGDFAGVYAFGGKGHRHGKGQRDPRAAHGPDWADAMGIDWMSRAEITQAIPPAYSAYLGRLAFSVLSDRVVVAGGPD
jgi:DNA (cytosine-5)-methyltransferase 1